MAAQREKTLKDRSEIQEIEGVDREERREEELDGGNDAAAAESGNEAVEEAGEESHGSKEEEVRCNGHAVDRSRREDHEEGVHLGLGTCRQRWCALKARVKWLASVEEEICLR